MEYPKPHLNYEQQVALLIDRGLDVPDRSAAIQALKRIGYYRLSAYTYPLRLPGTRLIHGASEPARRADGYVAGASLADAVFLHDFDERLRTVLLSGLQRLEVGLRAQIGYTLGKSHPFGHLDPAHLDISRCARVSARSPGQRNDHQRWLAKYEELQRKAKHEDFVKHFDAKYGGVLPIWAATEFMDFGCLTRLFDLLARRDATRIAEGLGVKSRDVLHGWLMALNVLRNSCAHNSRVWNRATVYPPAKPPAGILDPTLHHLLDADNNRLYFLAAICAQLLVRIDPAALWPQQFTTVARKFVPVHGMTLENSAGFPPGWDQLEVWRHAPR